MTPEVNTSTPGYYAAAMPTTSYSSSSLPSSAEPTVEPKSKLRLQNMPLSMMSSAGAFNIDSVTESLTTISDLSIGSVFPPKKGLPFCSSAPESSRPSSLESKAGSLMSTFGADTVSNFDLEYALLEQALNKDAPLGHTGTNVPLRNDKKIGNAVEPELYFSDILGDNGVAPQSLPVILSNDELEQGCSGIYTSTSHDVKRELNEAAMDSHLSTALASLGDGGRKSNDEQSFGAQLASKFNNYQDGRQSRNGLTTDIDALQAAHCAYSQPLLNHTLSQGRKLRTSVIPYDNDVALSELEDETEGEMVNSPISDSSTSNIGSHPDLYENLSADVREKVDRLQAKISAMPRRKLRESLARGVTIDDVEPLMCVNRDELAGMLGLGVTTWKMFVHHTLGIPRWPARALKSQQVKERKLRVKMEEMERRGDFEGVERVRKELCRVTQMHLKSRTLFRKGGIRKRVVQG